MLQFCDSNLGLLRYLGRVVLALGLASGVGAWGQTWIGDQVSTRFIDGRPVTVRFATLINDDSPVSHVIIHPRFSGSSQLKTVPANNSVEVLNKNIWVRTAPLLQKRGVLVAFVDSPDDVQNANVGSRAHRDMQTDVRKLAEMLSKKYPKAQVHLGYFEGVFSAVSVASGLSEVKKIISVSSAFSDRTSDWTPIKQPVLLFHAPTAACEYAPYIEVEEVARQHQLTLVKAGYPSQDAAIGCRGHHTLSGQESQFARVVADWLEGIPTPNFIGAADAQLAFREQVFFYDVSSTFGLFKVEATLFLPPAGTKGPGPYPVVVFNHGDIEPQSLWEKQKLRMRNLVVAGEFLNLGVAVIFPGRRGVGKSEGNYPRGFYSNDGDPTYKARFMAEDVLPVLKVIQSRAELNASKVIMAGQSAGGYLSMYIASLSPQGVIAAIDFSGGRTDMHPISGAGFLNKMMVGGFAEFGKTSRMPTLWIFAENDSRYSSTTIKASYEAFKLAGGTAELFLNPPLDIDGHFIYTRPALWRAKLKEFLSKAGAINTTQP